MSVAAQKPKATAVDLESLERFEVVGGELVEKAAPSFEHGDAQIEVAGFVRDLKRRRGGGPNGWWFGTEVEIEFETHEVYLPDVAGWRRDRVPDRPKGRPVRVRPDWVCEILSPSTASRDTVTKHHTFHDCGVGHYWIVDPVRETLTVLRWEKDGYLTVLTAGQNEKVNAEPFPEIDLFVGDLFGAENNV